MVGRGPGRRAVAGAVALCLVLCTACIGTTDRDDFEAQRLARSRGLPAGLPGRALHALAGELGTDTPMLRTLAVEGDGPVVTFEAVVPGTEDLEAYRYADGILSLPKPIEDTGYRPVGDEAFRPDQVPALDDLGAIVDEALEALDLPEGTIDSFIVDRGPDGVRLTLGASTDETSGQVIFDADGAVVEVTGG